MVIARTVVPDITPFFFAIRRISCIINAISLMFDSDMRQKICFTYSYRKQILPETMLEVTKKIGDDFFCDKSILEHGIEFIGLINKQGRMEGAIFNNDINLTGERKEMYMMKNQFVVTSVTDSLGKLMMMQELLCQCVADAQIPYQKVMIRCYT